MEFSFDVLWLILTFYRTVASRDQFLRLALVSRQWHQVVLQHYWRNEFCISTLPHKRSETRAILRGVVWGGFANRKNLPGDLLGELRRSGRRPGYPKVNRAIMRNLKGLINARARYPQVSAPVTLVYSEHDWSRPAERQQAARQLNVETITAPGVGHFSALESPTGMVRIIRQSSSGRAADA